MTVTLLSEPVAGPQKHRHAALPPLTKLSQETAPWQRTTSPWQGREGSPWQRSFSPWHGSGETSDQTKLEQRIKKKASGLVKLVKKTDHLPSKKLNTLMSIGGTALAGRPSFADHKLSVSTPLLNCRDAAPSPSRGALQGSRTTPGRKRDFINKTHLHQAPATKPPTAEDVVTSSYNEIVTSSAGFPVTSPDPQDEDGFSSVVGGIESYKHFALRAPAPQKIDLGQVYDRTYRPTLKLPKCTRMVTTINHQFINNNSFSSNNLIKKVGLYYTSIN